MKPDYKNWVPKSMVYGLALGTVAAFILFLLLGATGTIFHGIPRLICGIIFGIGTLVLLFFTVWMSALHITFDYNGKRKLAKTIIEGTANYVKLPDGGTGLDVGCGSGALTIASAKRNPKAVMVGCDIWSGAYKAVFTKKRCEDNAKAEGVTNVRFEEGNAIRLPFKDESFDVVINRNVTWNLQNPEACYAEWKRVLKPGGRLFVFDANWYAYLFDDEKLQEYEEDRENVKEEGLFDFNNVENAEKMEQIAMTLPLSKENRPEWDESALLKCGFSAVSTDTEIWQKVWDREEQINFGSTPMFLIQAVK
jgi:SAM-dependent methyltransferase